MYLSTDMTRLLKMSYWVKKASGKIGCLVSSSMFKNLKKALTIGVSHLWGNPLQFSCLENSTDRSLAGYSPWGLTELDTTERLILYWGEALLGSVEEGHFYHFNMLF